MENNNNNNELICPNCKERLTLLMPGGTKLYCKKCEKYYLNNNGSVGEETTSPYNKKDVMY